MRLTDVGAAVFGVGPSVIGVGNQRLAELELRKAQSRLNGLREDKRQNKNQTANFGESLKAQERAVALATERVEMLRGKYERIQSEGKRLAQEALTTA